MDIEIAMNMEIERDTETETDIGRGKGYTRSNFIRAHAGCPFVATLHTCATRSGGEFTELLPWTWASSARQWLFESSTESRQNKKYSAGSIGCAPTKPRRDIPTSRHCSQLGRSNHDQWLQRQRGRPRRGLRGRDTLPRAHLIL